MTRLPDDLIDPAEGPLLRRVGAYTDQAVFPIDPVAIAASAAVAGRRRTLGERLFGAGAAGRLALVAAGAVLVVAGAFALGGGTRGLLPPPPTADSSTVAIRMCTSDDVDAIITAWDGAAGSRIANVELHNVGSTTCSVDRLPQPSLAAGDGTPLILGALGERAGTIAMQPGDVLYTLVDVSNYCGPTPVAPVTVAFTESDTARFVAAALSPDHLGGLPPCDGPGQPAMIQMHPWSATAP